MFEIGSEFWTEPNEKGNGIESCIPTNMGVVYTLCGRTALNMIITDILSYEKPKTVYMPSYCCHTMIEPFLRNGLEIEFYNVIVSKDGIKSILTENNCDLVFLINYFGFIDSEIESFARKEREKGKIIIYDATHSLLCSNNEYSTYDYIYGSFRKWTGLNAGFAANHGVWTEDPVLKYNNTYSKLRNDSFDLKAEYIRNPEKVEKQTFLKSFQLAEELLETDYLNYAPDERSRKLMYSLDIDRMRKIRRKNAEVLINGLKTCQSVILPYDTIKEEECPLFVPVIIRNDRNALRKYLIDNSIYLPIHWPISLLHHLNRDTRLIYDEEMSCVCDQRYSESDMDHIVKAIRQFE